LLFGQLHRASHVAREPTKGDMRVSRSDRPLGGDSAGHLDLVGAEG